MAYNKVNWVAGQPPYLADGLPIMDQGVKDAHDIGMAKVDKVTNVSSLTALTGTSSGEVRYLLGYYAANDGGGGLVIRTTSGATVNGGTVFTCADGGTARWERLLPNNSVIDVRYFGARGIGSGGATEDQAAFSAAFAYVNPIMGTIYVPTGDYWVTGPFTQDEGVTLIGAGWGATRINHTGNNTFLTGVGAGDLPGPSYLAPRRWEGFSLYGNGGGSANGIRAGEQYAMIFRNLSVGYYTNGIGLEIANVNPDASGGYTEGTSFVDVMVRSCAKQIAFTRVGATAHPSMSNTRMSNVVMVMTATGQVGLDVGYGGNSVDLYGCWLDIKTHGEVVTTYGIQVGATSYLRQSRLHCMHEGWTTTSYPIRTAAGATVKADGFIDIASGVTVGSAIDAGSQVDIGAHGPQYVSLQEKAVAAESNFRGSGNQAIWWHAVMPSENTPYTGMAIARGTNIESLAAMIYADPANAFQVRSVAFGNKVHQGTTVFSVESTGHLASGGSAPSIANGTVVGTSPGTPTVTGNDTAGYITVITGTSPATTADGTVVTVTFSSAYKSAPRVILTPANSAAAAITTQRPYVARADVSTTQFVLRKPSATALGASTTYEFFYQVIQ